MVPRGSSIPEAVKSAEEARKVATWALTTLEMSSLIFWLLPRTWRGLERNQS